MLGALLEGAASAVLPCSLGLLIPGIAVVLAAGQRGSVASAAFVAASSLTAWSKAAVVAPAAAVGGSRAVLAGLLGIASALLWPPAGGDRGGLGVHGAASSGGPAGRRHLRTLSVVAGTALAGMAAGWGWLPCVGHELGGILSRAPEQRAATVLPLALYLGGVTLALPAVAALGRLIPSLGRWQASLVVARVGAAGLALLAALAAVGAHDDALSLLLRLSL